MIESAARKLATELVNRRESINRELSRNGVRFGIYKNGEYHDRLFPYDPVPRIMNPTNSTKWKRGSSSASTRSTPTCVTSIPTNMPSRTASCRRNTSTPQRAIFRRSMA